MAQAEASPFDPSAPYAQGGVDRLPPGTHLAEFEIRAVLGSGGFGIVYLAWDHALEREVALKEYLPSALALRGPGLTVRLRADDMAETFALGLRSFVNEARLLARFDHPSLVKVYRFWEDNGTAYMVMPRYRGRTLRQMRIGMVVPPGDAAVSSLVDALLSALEVLHKEGVYHRDIAPDNILVGDDGVPVLLDFGAARRVIGEGTQNLTSIIKPHFAPLEQYADQSAMRQGPWTDLYALGGTAYFLLTGKEPVPAASRALHDDQPRLADLTGPDAPDRFRAAIDWMLALKPAERPQSVAMLRDLLEGRIDLPYQRAAGSTAPGVAAATAVHSDAFAPTEQPPATLPPSGGADEAAALPRSGRSHLLYLLLAALVLLNGLAWWWAYRAHTSSGAMPAIEAALPSAPPAAEPTEKETVLSVLPAAARKASAPAEAAPSARSVDHPPAADAGPAAAAGNAPSERCAASSNFLTRLVCMKRECDRPALASHPECVRMREQEEASRSQSAR